MFCILQDCPGFGCGVAVSKVHDIAYKCWCLPLSCNRALGAKLLLPSTLQIWAARAWTGEADSQTRLLYLCESSCTPCPLRTRSTSCDNPIHTACLLITAYPASADRLSPNESDRTFTPQTGSQIRMLYSGQGVMHNVLVVSGSFIFRRASLRGTRPSFSLCLC